MLRKVFLAILFIGLAIGIILSIVDPSEDTIARRSGFRDAADMKMSEIAKRGLPNEERDFIAAVERARNAYGVGANDMAKGASRPLRAKEVCSAVPSARAENWIGTLATLSSNSDGRGVLGVEVAKDLALTTWNNDVSDVRDQTLLTPGSEVFNRAAAMKTGDVVRFSGDFAKSDTDCFRESSLTLHGSMTDPAYIMKFRSIELVK